MSNTRNPLGQAVAYPVDYAPELLFAVARAHARASLAAGDTLPFDGEDVWNAWELTWLDEHGRPAVATAELRVPASSPNVIESKSLKLYLGSLAMTRFPSREAVRLRIAADLGKVAGAEVRVAIATELAAASAGVGRLPGLCIDEVPAEFDGRGLDATLLGADPEHPVSEELHSHLLRSLCPVTGQPDIGSLLLRYRGPRIDRGGLLRYLVSYREHGDFHEACVERIFVDVKARCAPEALTVYARYNRRGGLDINPFRSDFETAADNIRLWRQ